MSVGIRHRFLFEVSRRVKAFGIYGSVVYNDLVVLCVCPILRAVVCIVAVPPFPSYVFARYSVGVVVVVLCICPVVTVERCGCAPDCGQSLKVEGVSCRRRAI